jgi:hypothetical protein
MSEGKQKKRLKNKRHYSEAQEMLPKWEAWSYR